MPFANLKLGRAFGIDVLLHWSFFLLPVIVIGLSVVQGDALNIAALRIIFLIVILASVVLHEFGHALIARQFGIPTRDIMLTPICGLARLERNPETPRQEIFVALAGPAANALLAVLIAAMAWATGNSLTLSREIFQLKLLPALFWINALLFLLNLIPVFPMDGGRILRAALASIWKQDRATIFSARVGQFISLAAACYGAYVRNYSLVIIGAFLFIAAGMEIQNCRDQRIARNQE